MSPTSDSDAPRPRVRLGSPVRVGTRNAAKLEAVRRGLEPFVADLEVLGVSVESGVSEQPIGLAEIVAGARNRARAAFDSGACELSAGLEDGLAPLAELASGYLNLGCCVLYDGREEALGFSAGFEYPTEMVREALGPPRRPIGDVFADRFEPLARSPAAEPGWGNIGALTLGALTRADYGAQAVSCAYVRRLHPEVYDAVYRAERA